MFTPFAQSLELFSQKLHLRKDDPTDIRLLRRIQLSHDNFETALSSIARHDFALIGYADDRGVDRNFGRLGASEAPDAVRGILYKMVDLPGKPTAKIFDFGNFNSWSFPLGQAHEKAREMIASLRQTGVKILTLGGGHDWAYADFNDFFDEKSAKHLINFDTHLDMRPQPEDPSHHFHSGTAFRRILENHPLKKNQQLSVVGLQKHANAQAHAEWALGNRVSLLFLEELPASLDQQWEYLLEKIKSTAPDSEIGLSLDMDVFSQSHAPGVSAPQAFGLDPRLALRFINHFGKQISHFGIYETNPRFDQDSHTSRLAARLIFEWMSHT